MPRTYDILATTTLTSTASSVTFSSFDSTYTDLVLVTNSARETGSYVDIYLRFNNDTSSNYYSAVMFATSGIDKYQSGAFNAIFTDYYGGLTSTIENHQIIHIFNYNNTSVKKTVLGISNTPSRPGIDRLVGFWNNTNAITRIDLVPSTGNYGVNSMFSLYGIKQA